MIGCDGWSIEVRQLKATVAIGCAQHSDFDTLVAHPSNAASLLTFNGHATFKNEAEFNKERDGRIEVFHHDADVVHTLDCHAGTLGMGLTGHTRTPGDDQPFGWATRVRFL